MKYFTKEELEEITSELLENPTRETLKKLYDKYNDIKEEPKKFIIENIKPSTEPVPKTEEVVKEQPIVMPLPVVDTSSQVTNPIPNFNIPNIDIPKIEENVQNKVEIPKQTFEVPKLDEQKINIPTSGQVNFSGNLFAPQPQETASMMQTTENFSPSINTVPTTEVPVSSVPFFGPHIETVNNQIPVSGQVNNMPVQGPSMFGQFEQNYM